MKDLDFRVIGSLPKNVTMEQVYDFLFDGASMIIGDGREHVPMLFAVSPEGALGVADLTGVQNDKDRIALIHQELAKQPFARASILVLEAWASQVRPKGETVYPYARVADDPQRREIVIFNFLTAGRQAVMGCPIDRKTKTVEKVPFQWLDTSSLQMDGRFIR